MDRAIVVLSGLLLNAIFAGPKEWYRKLRILHIFHYPTVCLRTLERKLNREHRDIKERRVRGWVLVIVAIILGLILGGLGNWLFKVGFIQLLLVTVCLPVRPTWDSVSALCKSLKKNDIPSARQALEGSAWRHYALLDEHGLARVGIEMLAVHFSEKILAPALAYLVFGLPGLFVSKFIYLLQETLSQMDKQAFADAAIKMHYILHYIPARIAALLWLAAAMFLPSVKITEVANKIAVKLFSASPTVLSLLSVSSVLNLSLGGPTSIYTQEAWVGSGTAKPTVNDMSRALKLFIFLHVLLFIIIGLFI